MFLEENQEQNIINNMQLGDKRYLKDVRDAKIFMALVAGHNTQKKINVKNAKRNKEIFL
jgi:hypothetical protein